VRAFGRALRSISRHLPHQGRLLDVGTAGGSFLEAARHHGFRPEGVEPNRWLAEWGEREYGVRIRPGTLFDARHQSESFDVVTVWDVIEHTPDPAAVLAECRRVLREDGTLVVSYPDRGSLIARLMGRRWPFLSSVHLYYFTRRTMREALERTGFAVVAFRPHFARLKLGYLLSRISVISPGVSRVLVRAASAVRLANLECPYWIGQTVVVARRTGL
jgi:SAM-dependent methyltransferase